MGKKFVFKNNEPLNELVSYILKKKDLEAILLNGELGAGKTTLVNAIAKKLGEKKPVISPTFNTILIYDNLRKLISLSRIFWKQVSCSWMSGKYN